MSKLLAINVNQHTEKKGQLTYLSWAWAWAEVLKADPAATWRVVLYGPPEAQQPCMWIGETAIVHTVVTIDGHPRECMLPVMDNKNNAVKLPDARKISDAIMRCMTKACAMHGLGLYIYAGEDLPEGDEPETKKPATTVPPIPMSPMKIEEWCTSIAFAAEDEIDGQVHAAQAIAQEHKDRDAWVVFRTAGQKRREQLKKPA